MSQEQSPKKEEKKQDVVLLHSRTEDGTGIRVIRARDDRVEAGEIRAAREGVPLVSGEVVRLTPREDSPLLWNVDVQYRVEASSAHAGPARVASRNYRQNWDAVFAKPSDGEPAIDDDHVLN
jgi:hypothetical protein